MRAEIIGISNGNLTGSKISMMRGDTLEMTLRVLRDDGSPILLSRFEEETHSIVHCREPVGMANHRLSIEFYATLKDGGDLRVLYRSTQSTLHVVYGATDEMTVVIDQKLTKRLPAPLALNFDMQVTEFDGTYRRMSTVYQGVLQIDKDFTTLY